MTQAATEAYGLMIDGLNCAKPSREQWIRTLAGKVSAINLTIVRPNHDFEQSMADLAATWKLIDDNADICFVARSAADIERARATGRLAIIMGSQNSMMAQKDLRLLEILGRIGFRILQPVYNEKNEFGCGAVVEDDTGVTERGREWAAKMNELGILIDLSHAGHKTAAGVIAASKRPIVFSHSNAKALCNSRRNIPDELIKAAADKGGSVGVTLWPPMVKHETRPTLDDFANHVLHMVKTAGIEHVAFGSDLSEGTYASAEHWLKCFGPEGMYPTVSGYQVMGRWWVFEARRTEGFETMAAVPQLWDTLRRRGLSQGDVEKIMGRNLLRVYRDVWGG